LFGSTEEGSETHKISLVLNNEHCFTTIIRNLSHALPKLDRLGLAEQETDLRWPVGGTKIENNSAARTGAHHRRANRPAWLTRT
jgi:hypothetical protein